MELAPQELGKTGSIPAVVWNTPDGFDKLGVIVDGAPVPIECRLSHARVAVERAVNRQVTLIAAIFKWPVPIVMLC